MRKRFEFKQGRNERAAKIDTGVRFPLQLNMLPYTNRAKSQDKENYELARSCTYDLLSVVVHVGEIDTGHYVTYCRVGDQVGPSPMSHVRARRLANGHATGSGSLLTITGSSWPRNRTSWALRLIYSST